MVHASAKPGSVNKQKAARMDEWNQLPLRGWSDMDHWLAGMSHQFTVEPPQTPNAHFTELSEGGFVIPQLPNHLHPSHGSIHSPGVNIDAREASTSYAWPSQENISMGSPYETHLRPPGMVSSPLYSRGQATGGSDGVASPAGGVQEYTNVAISSESGAEVKVSYFPYDSSMPPGGCSIWRPTRSLSSCYRWRLPLPQPIKIVKHGPLRYNQDGTKPMSDEA
ncbi:hypothetical protein PENSUB_9955 [Penicillium subrubescens]|uniref:Uncharacterized protein n=1 Tax=Penicillium subrubescens TaxID=1316194 RepID=A0A1Q5TBP9_9EURO|nr:hypothetical protein PENSUB_9955 [Penicillium subrubescens]